MYLIDANIFLEILLEQERHEECEIFINKIKAINALFYASSFTLHSIEVIMVKNNKINDLIEFLSDIIATKIVRIDTNIAEELNILKIMKKLKLDFDDSIQFYLCEKYNLEIISYDKHFDNTDIKRFEPKDLI